MRIPGKNSINININFNGGSTGVGGGTTINSRVYSSKGIIGDGTSSDPIKINTVENSGLKFDDNNKVLVDTDLIATQSQISALYQRLEELDSEIDQIIIPSGETIDLSQLSGQIAALDTKLTNLETKSDNADLAFSNQLATTTQQLASFDNILRTKADVVDLRQLSGQVVIIGERIDNIELSGLSGNGAIGDTSFIAPEIAGEIPEIDLESGVWYVSKNDFTGILPANANNGAVVQIGIEEGADDMIIRAQGEDTINGDGQECHIGLNIDGTLVYNTIYYFIYNKNNKNWVLF